jgi:hypothetical protein
MATASGRLGAATQAALEANATRTARLKALISEVRVLSGICDKTQDDGRAAAAALAAIIPDPNQAPRFAVDRFNSPAEANLLQSLSGLGSLDAAFGTSLTAGNR